ncbi:MAG TPA: hypothetical protein VFB72_01280 [Verrucomicrobiae bacterium]|nr:hypothetical protein [Verrucomicrobiae bacterium]
MKKTLMMFLFAGVCMMLPGCSTEPCGCNDHKATVYPAVPPPQAQWYAQPTYRGTRIWYRVCHRLWNDGYSFSNDPANHDVLAPVLGLDPYFPPAPLPYKSINQ